MQDYHYLAYQQWADGDKTVLEHLYYSLDELVKDIYSLEDDGRTFQALKLDPQNLMIEDVTEVLKLEMIKKSNREHSTGALNLNNIHPLIRDEFEDLLVAQDLLEDA